MQLADSFKGDNENRSRRPVAIMFRELNCQAIPRNLHVERSVLIEAMFPAQLEAGLIQVKVLGFFNGKDAQVRNQNAKAHVKILAQQLFQRCAQIGLLIAILHNDRRVEAQTPFSALAPADRTRTRHHDCALGNDERHLCGCA
jgi:hypothetical protein